MALNTQAVEDGLVGHQREERPLVLERLDAVVKENSRTGKQERIDWETGEGEMAYGGQKRGQHSKCK